jgi:uncharacterized protein (DUF1778 family)
VLTTYTQGGTVTLDRSSAGFLFGTSPGPLIKATTMPPAAITINVRVPVELRDLIDRVASARGKTRTDFILEASAQAAQRVLLDQVFFQVGDEQMQAFHAVMEQTLHNDEAVRRLMARKSPWER